MGRFSSRIWLSVACAASSLCLLAGAARADDVADFAKRQMRCDAWMEIHRNADAQAKATDAWAIGYLRTVAHDFAVDMARKTGARTQNDDGSEFEDSRVLTWLFLHCKDHPADTMTVTAMSWSMALSLESGPRPLPGY